MKILVTGGSGYLGTHVRRFFSADDFSRRSNSDILNARDLDRVADYDVVIHLAAHMDKSPASAELCFQTNAEGTKNLIQRMRPNSVFIYASTKDVYGSHANFYTKEVPESCATSYAGQSSCRVVAEACFSTSRIHDFLTIPRKVIGEAGGAPHIRYAGDIGPVIRGDFVD